MTSDILECEVQLRFRFEGSLVKIILHVVISKMDFTTFCIFSLILHFLTKH